MEQDLMNEFVQQGHDPTKMYQRKPVKFELSMISACLDSPTGRTYITACEMFDEAKSRLCQYTKVEVETDSDCDFLQSAFHGYAKAYMVDQIWYENFKPPSNAFDLIDQYMQHRPDDILSEYCKNIFFCRSHQSGNGSEFSKFKGLQIAIRTYEIFAMKVEKADTTSDIRRQILATLFNCLGSFYTITQQRIRAIDSFEKAYNINNEDLDSLFGVAWWHCSEDPEKAIKLFNQYLDAAPECDKKYYDAFYCLSYIYLSVHKDITKGKEYYCKGLDAEKKQLPCFPPYDTAYKLFAKLKMVYLGIHV
ncbi:unnamed protein product [Mytilus coruscus]|uniref:Uncharacterized protein n=1 Tax=Mytilus coruscus TaxID=42192 RepID=A0A6J8BHF2_MYTCO|nr:unnamed protein product [Mytilus coruscus]